MARFWEKQKDRFRRLSSVVGRRISEVSRIGEHHTSKRTLQRIRDAIGLIQLTLMLTTLLATFITIGMTRPGVFAQRLTPVHCTTVNASVRGGAENLFPTDDKIDRAPRVTCPCGLNCVSLIPCLRLFVSVAEAEMENVTSDLYVLGGGGGGGGDGGGKAWNSVRASTMLSRSEWASRSEREAPLIRSSRTLKSDNWESDLVALLRYDEASLALEPCSYLNCTRDVAVNVAMLKQFRDAHSVNSTFECLVDSTKMSLADVNATDGKFDEDDIHKVRVLLRRHYTDRDLYFSVIISWGCVLFLLFGWLFLECKYKTHRRVGVFIVPHDGDAPKSPPPSPPGRGTNRVSRVSIVSGPVEDGVAKGRVSPRTSLGEMQYRMTCSVGSNGESVCTYEPRVKRSTDRRPSIWEIFHDVPQIKIEKF